MCDLVRDIVFSQPKVFFRQVIDAAIGAPVDDADVNADQLRIDADDVALRNLFGT